MMTNGNCMHHCMAICAHNPAATAWSHAGEEQRARATHPPLPPRNPVKAENTAISIPQRLVDNAANNHLGDMDAGITPRIPSNARRLISRFRDTCSITALRDRALRDPINTVWKPAAAN